MRSALFVASLPEAVAWSKFLGFVDGKLQPHAKSIVRIGENVWLLDVASNPAPLAWLVTTAEHHGIRYGILPFDGEPQWLPAGFDPNTI